MASDFLLRERPAHTLRLVHWNIKELDSKKLQTEDHPQVKAAARILAELAPDLLSLNEIHDDPLREKSLGQNNLQDFLQRCRLREALPHSTLAPSNTGSRSDATQNKIDRCNFGLFPGQYATGLAGRFPMQRSLVIQHLKWMEWQTRDLSQFFLGSVSPEDVELFDKSLCVQWLDVEGRSLALVGLHAVPSFNFGQDRSPNAERNQAQMLFLQWFLTGFPLPSPEVKAHLTRLGIEALAPDQAFIAVGDFNSPLSDKRYPGGSVIKALLNHPRIHNQMALIPEELLKKGPKIDPKMSFFSEGWDYAKLPTQLDYMLVSRDLEIHNMQVVFASPDRQIHSIRDPDEEAALLIKSLEKPGRRVAAVSGGTFGRKDQSAIVSVSEAFARLRDASDHLPLILDFSWKES